MGNIYSGFNSKRNFRNIENNIQIMSSEITQYDSIIQSIKQKYTDLSNDISNNTIKIGNIQTTYDTHFEKINKNISSNTEFIQNLQKSNEKCNNINKVLKTTQDNISVQILEILTKYQVSDINIKELSDKFEKFEKFYKLPETSNNI